MAIIRVVLADDHPVVRSGVRALLEKASDIVVIGEARDGNHALKIALDLKPDVLLLDMEMPGLTGVEVARKLKDSESSVRVLALSAYDDEQYIEGLLTNGARGYLLKEEAPKAIVDAVRGVAYGEEGYLSRRVTAKMMKQKRASLHGDPLDELSQREKDVLKLLACGFTNGKIAAELGIAERTVRFHLHNIYDKLGITGRGEAIVWAVRRGF